MAIHRKCSPCYSVTLKDLCVTGLGDQIEKIQKREKDEKKRHVSKEKIILRLLRQALNLEASKGAPSKAGN